MFNAHTPTISCLEGCVHRRIERALYDKSMAEAEAKKAAKKDSLENYAHDDMTDLIGAIGQNGAAEMLAFMGVQHEAFPVYVPGLDRDDYDIILHGRTADVKSGRMGPYGCRYGSSCSANIEQKDKPMDDYIIVKVDLDDWMLHFPGVISHAKFWHSQTPHEDVRVDHMFGGSHVIRRIKLGELTPWWRYLQVIGHKAPSVVDVMSRVRGDSNG